MKSLKDASIYVKRLMQRFPSGSPEYEEFSSIMREFVNGNISSITAAAKVNALFKGHKDLIDEFNTFLPENNGVAEPPLAVASSKPPLATPHSSNTKARSCLARQKDCIKFLNELREDLKNDEKYREFLEALNEYDSHKDFYRLDKQVSSIFSKIPVFHLNFTTQTVDIHEAMYQAREEAKVEKRLNCEGEDEEIEDIIMKQQKKKSRIF